MPFASDGVNALEEEGDTVGRARPPEGVGMSGSRVVLAYGDGEPDDPVPDGSGVDGTVGTEPEGSAPGGP